MSTTGADSGIPVLHCGILLQKYLAPTKVREFKLFIPINNYLDPNSSGDNANFDLDNYLVASTETVTNEEKLARLHIQSPIIQGNMCLSFMIKYQKIGMTIYGQPDIFIEYDDNLFNQLNLPYKENEWMDAEIKLNKSSFYFIVSRSNFSVSLDNISPNCSSSKGKYTLFTSHMYISLLNRIMKKQSHRR